MENIFDSATITIHNALEDVLDKLLEENKCVSGDVSYDQQMKIDECIASLAEVTTSIIWQNRKQMTTERAVEILQKYVEADLESGTLHTDILTTLKEDCGCSNVELEEIGLEWI